MGSDDASTSSTALSPRKRNFAPKVKTGCLLCKTRKVKCDEGKPSCKRCLSRRQTCLYINVRAKIFDPYSRHKQSSPPSPTQIQPLTVRYGTSHETNCLAFFIKRTGPMLSMSSCSKEFWSIFVPQASWKFLAVKHMLVALSLLDQYLSSPMWTLVPDAEYLLALKSYNKAIAELTSKTNQPPSSSCILLTSVLAWMFEGISNRPVVANIHIGAALKIAAELRLADNQRSLSVEESAIVNTIEDASLGDSYTFLELWAPPDDSSDHSIPPIPAFQTLTQARTSLATIISTVKSHSQHPVPLPVPTDQALRGLRRWRLSFEAYRYKGIEPLAQKRQVFLHHNIVISCVALRHFSSLTGLKYRLILADTEALVASEDVYEIRDGLLLLLGFLLEDGCLEGEEELRPRAEKLQRKLERLAPSTLLPEGRD